MDFLNRGQPVEEENPGDMTAFAADIYEKQPFRGYTLKTALASTDRTAVFKAHDATMERTVAVKVLKPCRERENVVEEFFSLAGSIARLRCPGVARGLDVGRGDGNFFLVYEFARGETLASRLARLQAGKIAEKDSLRVVSEIATVLQSLFEHGHPHGHLTPSNCVQGEGGKIRLTDIGFAWTMAWRTDEEAFLTCPDFLPPERIEGEFNVDIRGDLYSLGCMWFRMLAGRPVFAGETHAETLALHVEKKPEQLHKLDEKITETTSTMVRWLLEKDRDARPRTPKEFLRKLSRHPLLLGVSGEGDDEPEDAPEPDAAVEDAAPVAQSPGVATDAENVVGLSSVEEEVEQLIRETANPKPRLFDEDAPEGEDAPVRDIL